MVPPSARETPPYSFCSSPPLSCLPFAQAKTTRLLKDKAKTVQPLLRPVRIANCVRVKQDIEVKARSHCVNPARHRVPSSRTGKLSHKLFLVIFFRSAFRCTLRAKETRKSARVKQKEKEVAAFICVGGTASCRHHAVVFSRIGEALMVQWHPRRSRANPPCGRLGAHPNGQVPA